MSRSMADELPLLELESNRGADTTFRCHPDVASVALSSKS